MARAAELHPRRPYLSGHPSPDRKAIGVFVWIGGMLLVDNCEGQARAGLKFMTSGSNVAHTACADITLELSQIIWSG